jgi:uncharacterized protein
MPEAHVEVLREVYAGWASGDFSVSVPLLDRNVTLVIDAGIPDGGVYVGVEGVRTYMRRFLDSWQSLEIAAERFRQAGDSVLVDVAQRGVGAGSGASVETMYFQLWTFRGGRVIRLETIMDEGLALEAAGLSDEPASSENVEIVRRLYDAVARHDPETVLSLYHPDVEWDFTDSPVGGALEHTVYRGHDGLRQWWQEWREAWDGYEDGYRELVEAGDRVVAVVTSRGRGRVSGAEMEWTQHGVWEFRDGKVLRVAWFRTREEALAAAGID